MLAGVNGAGKSSLGGQMLREAGLCWFNPDDYARELVGAGWQQAPANGRAWQEGQRRLAEAVTTGRNFAFETTLGGRSVTKALLSATATHDVLVWYVGLADVDLHVARVRLRVASGGHDIPAALIRARHPRSLANLIRLVAEVDAVLLFDNSASVAAGQPVPAPLRVAEIRQGRLIHPGPEGFRQVPPWARPVLEAALSNRRRR